MSVIAGVLSAVAALASQGLNKQYNDETRREQNIFNKYEAQRAREWNQQMDSTKYQRTVNDMQQAGVNPALAMNGGVTTQATSNAQAQSASQIPSNIDMTSAVQAALQAKQLQIQNKIADAQANELNTRAEKNKAETKREDINNSFLSQFNELRNQSMAIGNSLSEENIKQVQANVRKIDDEVELIRKQCATEAERAELTRAEKALKEATKDMTDATAKKIVEMLPYEKALMSAQTERERASAALSYIQKAYQSDLIDKGYIDAQVREMKSNADSKEAFTWATEYDNAVKSGDTQKLAELVSNPETDDGWSAGTKAVVGSANILGSVIGAFTRNIRLPNKTTYNQSYMGDYYSTFTKK